MSPNEVAGLSTGIAALLSVLGSVLYFAVRFGKIELKVDTLWAFQLRRGFAEAAERGLIIQNSPVKLVDKAKQMFSNLQEELTRFYAECGSISDVDFALALELKFGHRILQEVCIPNGINQGACLVIALAVAKQQDVVEVPNPKVP